MINNNDKISNIVIRDARIMFKNFSGRETEYNPAGRRNFSVILDEDIATQLMADGWNVKSRPGRDNPDELTFSMPVEVRFDPIPPNVFMISGGVKTRLTERNVGELDYAIFEKLDLTISPSRWTSHGRSGIKAYLETLYATVVEDELAREYADIPSKDYPREEDEIGEDVPFI